MRRTLSHHGHACCLQILTKDTWNDFNAFARGVNMDYIMTINGGQGPRGHGSDNAWNSENALTFLEYNHKMTFPVVQFPW